MSGITQWIKSFKASTPVAKPPSPPTPLSDPPKGSLEWYGFNYAESVLDLNSHIEPILMNAVDKIIESRSRYEAIERITKVPWYLTGALHCRESDLNFSTYLGNGDSLTSKTTHVPAGRGPFASWESGAVDALELDGLSGRVNWTIPMCLMLAEKFNGTGYLKYHEDVLSPYLWSFTSLYAKGKYGSDGHFDSGLVDKQPGVAAIFKELQVRGEI